MPSESDVVIEPHPPAPFGDSRLLACLALVARERASDLFLLAGAPPTVKRQGDFLPISQQVLPAQDIRTMAYSIMGKAQRHEFESTMECDFSYATAEGDRFRVNALLDHRNTNAPGHILTIEDPIEYLHPHKKSLITQREVGIDTRSYDEALRRAMREAPNVIMIGEIRDRATMQHALHYAESGHLCVSTLHAHNANQAVQRILNFFPEHAHKQLQMDLSLNLRAVIAQRLIKGVSARLVPATEVMLLTPYVADLIQKGQVDELKTAINRGVEQGMCSFDQSLFALAESGAISAEEAIAHADNRTDLSLKLRLAAGGSLTVAGMSMRENTPLV